MNLTILTDPIFYRSFFFREILRRLKTKFEILFGISNKTYRGHPAVTRSLINGLTINNITFNYNPLFINQVFDIVVVLAGVRTLKQAIYLKKKGKIKFLFAGPNIVEFSDDHDGIIGNLQIDAYIVNSNWTQANYVMSLPILKNRIWIWPCGVDINYWKPSYAKNKINLTNSLRIIFYIKDNLDICTPYLNFLLTTNHFITIIEYGKFKQNDYLHSLQNADLLVGISRFESQGIAWAEAWAANVPTLLLKKEVEIIYNRTIECSSAPYLTKNTGLFFSSVDELSLILKKIHELEFNPRKWVISNMSDEVCSQILISKILTKIK